MLIATRQADLAAKIFASYKAVQNDKQIFVAIHSHSSFNGYYRL
jgi:hypothetical protein